MRSMGDGGDSGDGSCLPPRLMFDWSNLDPFFLHLMHPLPSLSSSSNICANISTQSSPGKEIPAGHDDDPRYLRTALIDTLGHTDQVSPRITPYLCCSGEGRSSRRLVVSAGTDVTRPINPPIPTHPFLSTSSPPSLYVAHSTERHILASRHLIPFFVCLRRP
jgi:hypothetical protein